MASAGMPSSVPLDMIPASPPPKGIKSNFVNPDTLETEIITVTVASSALALGLVYIKVYSTLRITRSAWYDDAACVCAMVFSLAYSCLLISTKGNAKHGWDLPITLYSSSYLKITLAESMLRSLGIWFSKISILLFLHRLFASVKRSRYSIYIAIIWASVIFFLSIVIAAALCSPRSGESFGAIQVFRRCGRQTTWAVVQGSMNVLLDFFILYIPIPVVWKLQMGNRKKWGVLGIFLTGFIACISSVLCLVFKVELAAGTDRNWNIWRVSILNVVEVNASIMVACMPACASFFRFLAAKTVSPLTLRASISSMWIRISNTSNNLSASRNMSERGGQELPTSRPPTVAGGRYWRIKHMFPSKKGHLAPQNTVNHHSSNLPDESPMVLESKSDNELSRNSTNETEGSMNCSLQHRW